MSGLSGPVTEIPTVTLGGVELSLEVGQVHSWALTSGTQPHQAIFEVTAARARQILERGQAQFQSAGTGTRPRNQPAPVGPLTLEIRAPGRDPVVIQGLYVQASQPGGSINTAAVLVADRRWLFRRVLIRRDYNIRRRTGEFRVLEGEVRPLQVATRAADVAYRPATLKGDKPWKAREILEDVLTELCGQGGWVIDEDLPFADTVEGLVLKDPGDEALQRVLGFLPGAAVYAGLDGRLHVYNALRNGEIAVATAAGRPLWNTGNWAVVDRSFLRPQRVHVYFGRELEVRYDYSDDNANATRVRGREPRHLENVLPSPDATLTLANGRVVALGTWITVDQALAAWRALEDFPPELTEHLSQAGIRRFYMAGLSFLHHLFSHQVGTSELNAVWAKRINALQDHWRRTFRLLPAWRDKIATLRAYRCAVVDEETGTRAAAQAYFDHVVKLGARGLTKFAKGNDLGWNTTSWAANLAEGKVAPADVEVLDEDNGIIRITPRLDLGGLAVAVAPGTVDVIPKATAGETTTLWAQCSLAASWDLAVVVTCSQAVPNDLGQMHRETVAARDAYALLPGVVEGVHRAPDADTLVSEGIETARWGWVDDQATALEETFFDGKPPPPALMVNPATVRALAQAQAARVHAALLDRGEGSFAVPLKAGVVPTGSLSQVIYKVARPDEKSVVTTTTLVMPPIVVSPSITSLLPESVRRVVQKLVVS